MTNIVIDYFVVYTSRQKVLRTVLYMYEGIDNNLRGDLTFKVLPSWTVRVNGDREFRMKLRAGDPSRVVYK